MRSAAVVGILLAAGVCGLSVGRRSFFGGRRLGVVCSGGAGIPPEYPVHDNDSKRGLRWEARSVAVLGGGSFLQWYLVGQWNRSDRGAG